jgi:hypothetical protein
MRKIRVISQIGLAILFVFLAFSSCKDWLSVVPENDLIKERFWTKTADVDGALAATYNAFRKASLRSLILGEVRADLVKFTGSTFTNYKLIYESDISPTNGEIKWNDYYSAINLANTLMFYDKQVLEKDKTFTQKMKNGVDAEALFIRSLSYFYLVRLWKEVPLVLEPSISDTNNLFLPKSTEKEVLNQIINDLLIAKDLAYTTEFQGNPVYFNGRANKYSIMTLLADVYLWDQQYKKCMDYCDSVTNSGLFDIEPTTTWFNIYYPGNSPVESIFEIQYDDGLESQENPIYYNLLPISGSAGMTFSENTKTLFSIFDARLCEGRGPFQKVIGKDVGTKRADSERSANWILYRYADILLMKAEAATEIGTTESMTEANNLVRLIAERAETPYTNMMVQENLRKAILDERGREFIIEGKRWFDLLRAAKRPINPGGKSFGNKQIIIDMILSGAKDIQVRAILATKVYDTMSYYLPIPEQSILTNQNLIQNPYYDR